MRYAWIALLVGCAGSEGDDSDSGAAAYLVGEGFETGLSESIGCTDTWLQVWDEDNSVALEIYVAGIVAEAGSSTATRVIDFTDAGDDTMRAVAATPIADNYCTDGLVERTVHETWEATAGTLTVTVDASDAMSDPQASIELSDVTFTYGEASFEVSSATFADIGIIQNWGG
ncbi:MAG: hypothetical protein EP330_28640 [Deltaproteobacteria bacterium]|nr:MAG: hypothetical protein EP330_28640 [Deltaproteobacteria bacterium]